MHQGKRSYWVVIGVTVVAVSIFLGAVVGGTVGYVAAQQLSMPVQVAVPSPVVDVQPVTSTVPATDVEQQSLVITEESATVEAVEKALPAVVTVLSQGRFGGGTGSGFFISQDGFVVTKSFFLH